jgi:hypothetical protein
VSVGLARPASGPPLACSPGLDNAPMESLFASLKVEHIRRCCMDQRLVR